MKEASQLEIEADSGGVRLTGTIWRPAGDAVAGVFMHPGSGPSDRDNDVLFPPIREHLLRAGIAVCSFDKRGVGGSAGSWLDAGIAEQADDLLAGLAVFEAESPRGLPIGLFGHSQGAGLSSRPPPETFPSHSRSRTRAPVYRPRGRSGTRWPTSWRPAGKPMRSQRTTLW